MTNSKCVWVFASAFIIFNFSLPFCFAAEQGTLAGFVKFPGETPPRFMFANATEHACPHGIGQNHLLVEQRTRGLQNALVVLELDDKQVTFASPARRNKELHIERCVLTPRIQATLIPASLQMINHDDAKHVLRLSRRGMTAFEARVEPGGTPLRRPLVNKGLYQVDCDSHLWERAWIYASDHPFVAVTDAHGKFMIQDVPPGRYRIRAWHEGWVAKNGSNSARLEFQPMEQTLEVAVKAKKTTDVVFDQLSATWADH